MTEQFVVAGLKTGQDFEKEKAPASEGGRYRGKERLADSQGTIYRAPTCAIIQV